MEADYTFISMPRTVRSCLKKLLFPEDLFGITKRSTLKAFATLSLPAANEFFDSAERNSAHAFVYSYTIVLKVTRLQQVEDEMVKTYVSDKVSDVVINALGVH